MSALSFVIFVGAMLIVYGYNKELTIPIVGGILLICLSTCGFPSGFFLFKHIKKKRKEKKLKSNAQKDQRLRAAAFDNPIRTDDVTVESA
jgi:hypothetical protein